MVLRVSTDEILLAHTSFQIRGPGAVQVTDEEYPYEIDIYGSGIIGLVATLLASYRAKLIKETFDYTVPVQISRQPVGIYRLWVVVKTDHTINQRRGPVILVE